MPFQAQIVVDRMAPELDAEGADYYTFNQDYKPSINKSIEWLITVFNQILGDQKTVPEQLRELTFVKIWQANKYSRISYNPADTGHKLWSILSVIPEPNVHPNNSITPLANPLQSKFVPNKSFIGSDYSAARMSTEEWSINTKNPFVAGNTVVTKSLKIYGYKDFADYSSSTYLNPVNSEIEIRPSVAGNYVAIEYLKYPTPVVNATDLIEFPESMISLISEKALSFISVKQGDNTNVWGVSENDIKRIIGLFS